MRQILLIIVISMLIFFCCPFSYANNIKITNARPGDQDETGNTMVVEFGISWENSWRDNINYDAAWVFLMISTDGGINWRHGTLKANNKNPLSDGFGWSKGGGTDIEIVVPVHSPMQSGDKKGAFIQRPSDSSGTLNTTNIRFVWDYGSDGISDSQASHPTNTELRVMAIEMIYIPAGPYYIGDGNGGSESVNAFHVTDNTRVGPIGTSLIQNIKVDDNSYDDPQLKALGIGIDGDDGIDVDNNGGIENIYFPTGYKVFYIMKYEISQGQYTDFLNSLNATQANNRYPDKNGLNRHTIDKSGTTYVCSTPERATNYISWMDICAYADWAALRPVTELEFEKACRGPEEPIINEYAWGNNSIHNAVYTLMNDGLYNSTVQNQPIGIGNAFYNLTADVNGPLRCGIYAQAGTSRDESGASYYGVMELSGNLWERTVTVGNSTGRNFQGSHGDGTLNASGNATNADWPGYISGEVVGATGAGGRGGAWPTAASLLNVSDRTFGCYPFTQRNIEEGGRLGRSAP